MQATLIIIKSPFPEAQQPERIALPMDKFVLGRSRQCDLTLADRKLSKFHCRIYFENERFWLSDENSTNGTYLDGKRVSQAQILATGSVIQLGDTQIQFTQDVPEEDTLSIVEELGSSEKLPAMIEQYQILGKIGGGGIGEVYKARDHEHDRVVALKLLRPDVVGNQKYVARFMKEARASAQLSHPAIVETLDFGMDNGCPYLVLEYVPSRSLLNIIQEKGRLSFPPALKIAEQVAEALVVSHEKGFVHRDIKPGNILVSPQLQTKVIDMGLVKILDETGFTISGQSIGTPRYMSPEQIIDSKSVDGRTDIYSLGATLYHCFCGKPPFFEISGKRIAELLKEIYYGQPTPLASHVDLPKAVLKLVEKAMAKQPKERYRDATAFLKEIRKIRKKIKKVSEAEKEPQEL